ncbi:DUF456 family protein [Halorussus litoreus]|uniref:DUF456 family protein n=1 Tax=Halorussus litoreus TaxID=1710536 RepID=UPI0037448E60
MVVGLRDARPVGARRLHPRRARRGRHRPDRRRARCWRGRRVDGDILLATAVSIPLLFVAGPVGLVLGVAAAVFAAEFSRTRSAGRGARAAVFAAVGVLGSAVVQLIVTLSLLVGFVLVSV